MSEQRELLLEQDYDIQGYKVIFYLYRIAKKDEVEIDLTYVFQVPDPEEVTCKRFFYPARAEEYESPYLSWYNLICCSNNYGPIPVLYYMNHAVQNGKKLAATIYPENVNEYNEMLRLPADEFNCFPFNIEEYQYMLYICKKGTLADYFELDEILKIYKDCGIDLDAEKMKDYFEKDLSWFANTQVCPIEIHNALGNEELVVVGLLFGYPIESTIALLNKTIDMCEG